MGIPERKEREKEARKEEILTAAERIFFDKGLQQATMDEIAQAAELGKSTLYLYYKSKEDLYLAVMNRGADVLHDLFVSATTTGEPTLKLIKNLGDAYFEFFQKYRNYFRMYYFFENQEMHTQVSDEMKTRCFENDQRIWEIVVGLIRKAKDEGLLRREVDPTQTAVMLWSNCNGLMRQMDRMEPYWRDAMRIDLETTLRKGNAYLLEGMMTEKAKEQNPGFFDE